jgi:hypothetical protein
MRQAGLLIFFLSIYRALRLTRPTQTLREMSESPECVAALVVAGLPVLCVDLLRSAIELHDPATQASGEREMHVTYLPPPPIRCVCLLPWNVPVLLQEIIELLWNMLEQTTPGASSKAPSGDAVAVTASHMLEKYRARSAAHALGTPEDISFLWQLASNAAHRGYTDIDKQLRNDLVVILTLLARRHGNRGLFLGQTGVLADALAIVTAPELVSPGVHLLYGTHAAVDLEFKELLWGFICQVCQGDWNAGVPPPPAVQAAGELQQERQQQGQQQHLERDASALPSLAEEEEYKNGDDSDVDSDAIGGDDARGGGTAAFDGQEHQQPQESGVTGPSGNSPWGWAHVLESSPLVPAFLLYLDPLQVRIN